MKTVTASTPSLLAALSALLVLACPTGLSASDASVEKLVVFGDGLSDTGNAYNQSLSSTGVGRPAAPDYFDGRASNGPLWIEHLAAGLQLAAPEPVLLGGSNYAWYGAGIGAGGTAAGAPAIAAQVDTYLGYGNHPDDKQLIVIWAGLGNFVNAAENAVAIPDPTAMSDDLVAQIEKLLDAVEPGSGPRFLVANLPPLGQTAYARWLGVVKPELPQLYDRLTRQLNALLSGRLRLLARERGIEITELDVFGLTREIAADPAAFGFSNTSDPALTLQYTGVDADDHVFHDELYPTTRWHEIVAERALQQLNDADQ